MACYGFEGLGAKGTCAGKVLRSRAAKEPVQLGRFFPANLHRAAGWLWPRAQSLADCHTVIAPASHLSSTLFCADTAATRRDSNEHLPMKSSDELQE